jgi:hypothetical protein
MVVISPISQVVPQSQGVRNVTKLGEAQFQGPFPTHPEPEFLKIRTQDAMFVAPMQLLWDAL